MGGGAEDQDQGPRLQNEKMIDHMKVGKGTLLMIDKAQSLTRIIREEIRLLMDFQLNDRFLATIILLGQPELREKVGGIPQFY
ncbi:MAG: ATP-binding protein, partial [Desulfobacterales bacterium]|nr:ATP-binding protein [Desulfobacterales bacterium]